MKRARKKAFFDLQSHALLRKPFSKLTGPEIDICLDFIKNHGELPKGDFQEAVNRMFIDMDAEDKPKHFVIILEMLSCANTIAHQPPEEKE